MNPTQFSTAADGNLVAVTKAVLNRVASVHGHDLPAPFADALADALDSIVETAIDGLQRELILKGFTQGLFAAFGPELGQAVLLQLSGRAAVSGAKLCPNFTRASVSKAVNRARRHLGIRGGCPNNARAGRSPKN